MILAKFYNSLLKNHPHKYNSFILLSLNIQSLQNSILNNKSLSSKFHILISNPYLHHNNNITSPNLNPFQIKLTSLRNKLRLDISKSFKNFKIFKNSFFNFNLTEFGLLIFNTIQINIILYVLYN